MPTRRGKVLSRAFYARPTLEVAKTLLGKVLVHRARDGAASGMIVEVEAYIGEDDPACHAASGPTRRNAPLYGPPGLTYVYLNYGVHNLLNVVTESEGTPAAVLIRALAPLNGLPLMASRRGFEDGALERAALCRGPGNLARALGITLAENQFDVSASTVTIEDRGYRVAAVSWGPRIGIRVGTERPWRCWYSGHPAVSGPRQSPVVASRTVRRRGRMLR